MKHTRRPSVSLVTNRDVLMNVQFHHKWWSTLKSAVYGLGSLLPPLVSEGGGLECGLVGKADLLSNHFVSKHVHFDAFMIVTSSVTNEYVLV